MKRLLEYIELIRNADTTGVEPLIQPVFREDIYRDDEVSPGLDPDSFLSLAPQTSDGMVVVPSSIGDR